MWKPHREVPETLTNSDPAGAPSATLPPPTHPPTHPTPPPRAAVCHTALTYSSSGAAKRASMPHVAEYASPLSHTPHLNSGTSA